MERVSKKITVKKKRTTEELIAAALAKDARQDKSRKTPTKLEKADALLKNMMEYDANKGKETEPVIEQHKAEEWDVKIDDPIEYFDPTLSYELTGYRPLTTTESLDFDPKLFTVAANTYRKNGRYTLLIPGTFKHRNHWIEEFRRCKEGLTIGRYRLTGENYFFLNYYRLLSVLGDGKGGEIREEDFPGFMAKLYEYFHYLEMARKLGYDALIFKCRGIGYSEMIASNLACAYTFHKASRNIIAAASLGYVDDTLAKTWQELDFLNTSTEGGFRRVRMKIDTAMKKRASKVDKDKNETGWMSEIEGRVVDNPRKLRGARTYSMYFDEGGSFPGLINAYILARALVDILGYRVGMRVVGGTGGDMGEPLAGLQKMFFNPDDYQIFPYKNNYSNTGKTLFTGFFVPSFEMWFGSKNNPGFDNRGVVDTERAKQYYLNKWAKIKDPHAVLKDKAEYCFSPEDAFILEGENRFDSDRLVELYNNITIHKIIKGPLCAKLHWAETDDEGHIDKTKKPRIEFVTDSPLKILELPKLDLDGIPFKDLYLIGVDSIDSDSTTSTGQTDVSKFCAVVYRRAFGIEPPKVVATYLERPLHINTAFDTALKLCLFYNAQLLFEASRVSIKYYFEKELALHLLMKRPKETSNRSSKTNLKQYGVPAVGPIIDHQLDLIEEYIVNYCEELQFPELIDELVRYSYANKRKFDMVAAFAMALLADEAMRGKTVRLSQISKDNYINLSYYKNEYGLIEFGALTKYTSLNPGVGAENSGNDMWTLW